MKKLLLILLLPLCVACQREQRNGEYFFVSYTSPNGLIHVDRHCNDKSVIKPANQIYTEKAQEKGLTWNFDFCSKCIDNKQMKQIEDSIAYYIHIASNSDNKRKLYDALSKDYDMGTFEQFSSDIADEGKRRKLYDAIKDEYDLPDFDGFSKQLGIEAPNYQANDNLHKVYNTLLKEGYNPPAFEQFARDMEDENNLRGVYSTLQKEGYKPPKFETFKSDMGL